MQFDSRIQLEKKENGNTLIIGLADPSDEAEYVCSVSAYKKTEMKHNVRIRGRGRDRDYPDSFSYPIYIPPSWAGHHHIP